VGPLARFLHVGGAGEGDEPGEGVGGEVKVRAVRELAVADGDDTRCDCRPSLVIKMLRHTRASEGMDVLDVGTAPGYSTALLAHRFGDRHVTSVDVDPYLTDAARSRPTEIGRKPEIVHADAIEELPGTYDRVVAMVAMPRIPASWLTAPRPGDRLVTTLAGATLIISAEKTPDGGTVGRVERDWAGFMNVRHGPTFPPRRTAPAARQLTVPPPPRPCASSHAGAASLGVDHPGITLYAYPDCVVSVGTPKTTTGAPVKSLTA